MLESTSVYMQLDSAECVTIAPCTLPICSEEDDERCDPTPRFPAYRLCH